MQYKFTLLLTSVLLALEVSATKKETKACGVTLALNYNSGGHAQHVNKDFIHEASAKVSDWTISSTSGKDPKVKQYDAEHVFESQTVGAFFDQWLPAGKVFDSSKAETMPSGVKVTKKRDCTWIKTNAMNPNKWNTVFVTTPPKAAPATSKTAFTPSKFGPVREKPALEPLAAAVYQELGSATNPDIMLKYAHKPNDAKGRLFSAVDTVNKATYVKLSSADKFARMKEMTLNFNYLNSASVVTQYCVTYEKARTALLAFDRDYDAFYKASATDTSNLAAEWKAYNQAVTYNVVENARKELEWMYQNRAKDGAKDGVITKADEAEWEIIRKKTKDINLDKLKCTNLSAPGNKAGVEIKATKVTVKRSFIPVSRRTAQE